MATICVNGEVSVEDAQRVLSERLGTRYQVIEGKGGSELIVKRNAIAYAPVRMSWSDGTTTFEVHGSGLVALRVVNAFGIARRVTAAVRHGFSERLAA